MARRPARMSPGAERWFLEEIACIAGRSPSAAAKLVDKMRKLRERLADFPDMGVRGDIPGTRRMVLKPFALTVRSRGGEVEIAAIRHAKQGDAYVPSELLEETPDEDFDGPPPLPENRR
jgi:plasmid stabilization system protein ParE